MDPEEARAVYNLKKDTRDWKVRLAQRDLVNSGLMRQKIVSVLYKPFDKRYSYYTGHSRGFHRNPANEVMQHMLRDNVGLVARRNCRTVWHDASVTDSVIDRNYFDAQTYLFPLYVYQNSRKECNIKNNFIEELQKLFRNTSITPEDILGYLYAILYSPSYRNQFQELLKNDFPRIPLPDDYSCFIELSKLGNALIDWHLMRKHEKTNAAFDISGSNVIDYVKHIDGKIYINKTQFFGLVPENVWQFKVGGFQVLDKWLKSRKGRELSSSEIEYFLQIVEIIKKTIEYMKEIDSIAHFA